MRLEVVHNANECTLLRCISGSRAYGLQTPASDTDIRGVYYIHKDAFYGFEQATQVANETNDVVYYELGRYMELLSKNNPNILELLSTPEDCILYRHEIMNLVKPELFLSKLCEHTFAGYAFTQIKKASSLNKKIFNPIDKERKTILDFCYIIKGAATIPLSDWLQQNNFKQEDCGLSKVTHAKDIYVVYHSSQATGLKLEGICSGMNANDVSLSSVPVAIEPIATMSFNKDGYSVYCKDYKEYWDWVGKRNDVRYQDTLEHGKNYDAKNMMHTFRLLNVAEEIAREKRVNVRRHDRDFLLGIKAGAYTYEDLIAMANEKVEVIKEAYAIADLPDKPDVVMIEEILVSMRSMLYK